MLSSSKHVAPQRRPSLSRTSRHARFDKLSETDACFDKLSMTEVFYGP
jgi:hypothetical protein